MRDKRPHTLPAVRRLRYPKRFVFFDSESTVKGWEETRPDLTRKPHVPRLIVGEFWEGSGDGAYARREDRDFRGAGLCERFWGWLSDLADLRQGGNRGSVVAVAHNVGYDVLATGGADHLTARGWIAEAPYEKGPVFIWRWSKNGRTLTILSSTNFYQAKLAAVGEAYGCPKLDTDTQTEDIEELAVYCRRDVEIVRRAILGLVEFLATGGERPARPIGPWADTLSSVAFKAFRFGFLRHRIELHVHPVAEGLERAAYHGGRTQPFLVGQPCPLPIHDLDINSLYPSVMIDQPFPIRLLQVREGDDAALRETVETGGLVIADVEVTVERPCIPYVDTETAKLTFPVGTFRATLTSPELAVAYREGIVRDVRAWAVYEGAAIFADYIAAMYSRRLRAREEGREAISLLFKYLMNNLYGKFGQKREVWTCVGPCDPSDVGTETFIGPDGKSFVEKRFNGQRWVCAQTVEAYNSFPAIAAFVTAYARVRLWSAMNVAGNYAPHPDGGRQGREFYYCDTDSLFVSDVGRARLDAAGMIDSKRLGALKVEKTITQRAIFFGAKAYWIDDVRRHKGLPKDHRTHWDDGTEVRTPDGEPGAAYDAWPHLATAIREGSLASFANRTVVKRLRVDYDKDSVGWDGWTTPWRLPRTVDIPKATSG